MVEVPGDEFMCEARSPANLADNSLIRRLMAFGFDPDDFVIFGSGPLLAHGIRRSIADLDVVARGGTWRRATTLGVTTRGEISGLPVVQLWGGRIQLSERWISSTWETDDLIDRAEIIQGLRFAQLSDVLAYKRMLMRPKDLVDIQAVCDHLRRRRVASP